MGAIYKWGGTERQEVAADESYWRLGPSFFLTNLRYSSGLPDLGQAIRT
jgi:hypothetical protein